MRSLGILACVKFIVELSWFYQISIDFLSTRVKKIIVTKKETKAAFLGIICCNCGYGYRSYEHLLSLIITSLNGTEFHLAYFPFPSKPSVGAAIYCTAFRIYKGF